MFLSSSSCEPSTRRLLSVALGIALVLRLAALFFFGDLSSTAVLWEYGDTGRCAWQHGGQLCSYYLSGGAYYPSAYMPPLLSYFWLGLFELFGDGPVARAIWLGANLAAALGCVALTYYLSLKLISSRWVAFVAATLMAVYPTFVYVTAEYHQTNWAVLLLLGVVAIAVKLADGSNPWLYGAIGGILCGISALNRSEMIIVGPILIALGAFWNRDWRRVLTIGLTAAVTLAGVIAPWTVRNYEMFGRIIPVAQSQGYNLWKGYNPYTNGSGNLSEEGDGLAARERIRATVAHGPLYETRLQEAYSEEFRHDLHQSSPGRLVRLTLNKVALLWAFDWTDRDVTHRSAYLIPWIATNLLAFFGFFFLWRWRRWVAPAQVVIYANALFFLTAAYALTAVHARYRMHIEPFIFILAAVGLVGLWAKIRVLQRRTGEDVDGELQIANSQE